jgi:hypothetical protein
MGSDIAAKLDEARALIEKGWTQGDYADEQRTCFCIYGAIQQTLYGDPEESVVGRTEEVMVDLLKRATGSCALVAWNDAPKRTQAEVIDAFKRAAELARGEQVK